MTYPSGLKVAYGYADGQISRVLLNGTVWLDNISYQPDGRITGALGRLHQGELEAMILAKEITADYVVLDDLLARNKAQKLGIKVIGTIGLLFLLEKRKLLNKEQVWQKINQLTEQHGMYLSTPLLQQLRNKLFDIH